LLKSAKSSLLKTSKSAPLKSSQDAPQFVPEPQTKEYRESVDTAAPITDFAVGYNPPPQLSPQDEVLFKSFQSNLLSLISHELRTPLMGILNSLSLLEEPEDVGISAPDLIRMARNNAQRLNQTLASLLDLAAIESGTFHVRLREIDFSKTIRNRVDAMSSELKGQGLKLLWEEKPTPPLLGDPQRVSRAIDLCLQAIVPRVLGHTSIEIRVAPGQVEFWFQIRPDLKDAWEKAGQESLAGYEGGVASPTSAFAGVLQSEQAFLTRQEEGLGSEFLLIYEIMRLHQGEFVQQRYEASRGVEKFALVLKFPEVTSEAGLRAVLTSRAYDVSTELKSVALVLIAVPEKMETSAFSNQLKSHLFRTSDAVYPLPEKRQAGLVLDDCRAEDVPHLIGRLKQKMGPKYAGIKFGSAHCPSDGQDPSQLFDLAEERLNE
jgi:His Kinase A (phospho-acceptor) domain